MLSGRSPTTWLIASFVFSVTLTAAGAAAHGQSLTTYHPSEIQEGVVFGAEGGIFGQTVADGGSTTRGVWGGSWVADLTLAWTRAYEPEHLKKVDAIPFRGPRWTRHWGVRFDVSGLGSLVWLDKGSSSDGADALHNFASVRQSFELGLWLLSIGQTFEYQERAELTDRVVLGGRNVTSAGGFIDFQGFGILTEDYSVEVLSTLIGVEDRWDTTGRGEAQTGIVLTVDSLGYGGGASWNPDEALEHFWVGRTVLRKYIEDQEEVNGLWRGVQALDFRFDFLDASVRLSSKESLRFALGLSVIKPEQVVVLAGREGEVAEAGPSTLVPELMLGVRRGGRWRMDNGRSAPVLDNGEPFSAGLELASMHRLEGTSGAIDVGGQGILWAQWDVVDSLSLSAEGYLGSGKRVAELEPDGTWAGTDDWIWLGRLQAGVSWFLGRHLEMRLEGWGEYSDRELLTMPVGSQGFRWQAGAEMGVLVRY